MASLTGDKQLDRQLSRLGKAGPKVAAAGIRVGLRVILKAVKSEFPPSAKSIRKGLGQRFKRRRKQGIVEAKVGVGVGKKKAKQVPHANLFVAGTQERFTKAGKFTGVMPANDVVDRGFSKSKDTAEKAIITGIREGILKEARRK